MKEQRYELDTLSGADGRPPPDTGDRQHPAGARRGPTQRRGGGPGGRLQGPPEPIGYVAGAPATGGTNNNNNNSLTP